MKKAIPLTIVLASKKIKYLSTQLKKDVQNRYVENYTILQKEIKMTSLNGEA